MDTDIDLFVFFNSILLSMTPTELCSGFNVQLASLKRSCKILYTSHMILV